MQPLLATGSKYEFLAVQFRGRYKYPNGIFRNLLIGLFYGPNTPCEAAPNGAGQKFSLVTGSSTPGATGTAGVMQAVITPLLAALGKPWINNGVYSRWFDAPGDPWQPCGGPGMPGVSPAGGLGSGLTISTTAVAGALTAAGVTVGGTLYALGDIVGPITGGTGGYLVVTGINFATGAVTALAVAAGGSGYTTAAGPVATTAAYSYTNPTGDGGVAGACLPLDNNVTIRKYTAVRGKNWKGNIRPCPISESHVTTQNDQLNAAGMAAWKPLVGTVFPAVTQNPAAPTAPVSGIYSQITDGDSVLVPILVSVQESQLIQAPTRIAYAPLQLPGIDPVGGGVNSLIDFALGESKRRKEKHSLTF